MLILKGYFIKVNKYGKLKFRRDESCNDLLLKCSEDILGSVHIDYIKNTLLGIDDACDDWIIEDGHHNDTGNIFDDSKNNTASYCIHLPFDDLTFTVVLPKWIKNPPHDIMSRVGMICTIEVKPVKYEFLSTKQSNSGEYITGFHLVFSKVIKGSLQ